MAATSVPERSVQAWSRSPAPDGEANSLAERGVGVPVPEAVVSTSPTTVDVEKDAGRDVGNGRRLVTQQSSVWTRRQQAVCVRHAFKHYGSNKNPNHVLQNLNMTVPKGTM
ncbi:Ubiquinone biosynthesis monooxygenase COQ6, mitochondrial [Frankliniella fusca]|uniref:Ubiquinone biosynthesis monooxygenase COQ6, mitochondrial n=1 Tax=Frankliniella fusca TaxID=407009 RepID=A0AAE1I4F9_9NEOP|nr:Ubiquinone biosynthesis monooxygenase COQ6, mitochondrial [Frankliniella fusca]